MDTKEFEGMTKEEKFTKALGIMSKLMVQKTLTGKTSFPEGDVNVLWAWLEVTAKELKAEGVEVKF